MDFPKPETTRNISPLIRPEQYWLCQHYYLLASLYSMLNPTCQCKENQVDLGFYSQSSYPLDLCITQISQQLRCFRYSRPSQMPGLRRTIGSIGGTQWFLRPAIRWLCFWNVNLKDGDLICGIRMLFWFRVLEGLSFGESVICDWRINTERCWCEPLGSW